MGTITGASRVGSQVIRATGPWTPAVHALLRHLESVGFEGAPRVLGVDDGCEILTYIEGEAAAQAWPRTLFGEAGIASFGKLIRDFHHAVAGFVPPPDAVYRTGQKALGAGEVVCHGDLARGTASGATAGRSR